MNTSYLEVFGLCLRQELGYRWGLSKFVGESNRSKKSDCISLHTLLCVLTGMWSWSLPSSQTLLHHFQASLQFEWFNGVQMRKSKVASFLNKFKCQMDQVLHFLWVFSSPLKNIWVICNIYNPVKVYKSKLCVRIIAMAPCANVLYSHLIWRAKETNSWHLGRADLPTSSRETPRAKSWRRHSTTPSYSDSLRVTATQCSSAGRNASGARRNSFGTYLLRQILLLAAPHWQVWGQWGF